MPKHDSRQHSPQAGVAQVLAVAAAEVAAAVAVLCLSVPLAPPQLPYVAAVVGPAGHSVLQKAGESGQTVRRRGVPDRDLSEDIARGPAVEMKN